MDMLNLYAEEYDAHNWNEFVKCFNEIDVEIEGLPQDIVNVVLNLLGHEMGYKWLNEPFHKFDDKTALELMEISAGERALKAYIMRLPN